MLKFIMESAFLDDQVLLEMHPSIRRAFEQGSHPLSKHPVFQKHGKSMSTDEYGHLMKQYKERTGKERFDPSEIMVAIRGIQQIERQHADTLKRLAIDIVSKAWGVDPSIFAEPELTNDIEDPQKEAEHETDDQLTPEQQAEVEKRITMNMLTHGSAIHVMTTMHHMAKDALDRIDPRLVKLYDRFSTTGHLTSWYMDLENILQHQGQNTGGTERVEWQNNRPKIVAQAQFFPILLHELSKGVMEVLTMHQLSSLDPETLHKVYKHADKHEHERFHYFVGPAVWRKFLKVVPRPKLARVVAALARLKSNEVTAFVNAVIEDPQMATQMVNNLVRDPKGTVEEL